MKHEIEIKGLPEGFELTKIKITNPIDKISPVCALAYIQKIKPRRIVLEETDTPDNSSGCKSMTVNGISITICGNKIWSEVKECE